LAYRGCFFIVRRPRLCREFRKRFDVPKKRRRELKEEVCGKAEMRSIEAIQRPSLLENWKK
jgi:hypothetical protein